MDNIKELDILTNPICPHCGKDVSEYITNPSTNSRTIDVEKVENNEYGIQARWKELYTCPYCGKKFYVVCEH